MADPTPIPAPANIYALSLVPRWTGFLAACVGMFMAILDIQVVVTSLPVIESALAIGADRMSWVQTSYLIAEVVAIPITGLLMRVFSMRWLFGGAIIAFTLASIGCAQSTGFIDLMVWRVIQGFAGGILIPLVFSAVFLLFPRGIQQTLATTIGGFLAVLAPTLGPVTGGWITEHYSWHWLFLINVAPGLAAALAGLLCLPVARINTGLLARLDWLSLFFFGVGLGFLIVGLKEAPGQGWLSVFVLSYFALSLALMGAAVMRPAPAIMFYLLKDRALAFGCILSFILGFVLFSAVYVMPVFLAFVRGHGPLAIGLVTIVMGITQIFAAPAIVQIDRFFDARFLSALGFAVFGVGLAMNANLTVTSDYDAMYWPQIVRGVAVALCILPPIRLALSMQPIDVVSDASGLFNVVRNIGGAIGIAVMDTVMFSRSPEHADAIMTLIRENPAEAAAVLDMAPSDLPAIDDAMSLMGIMDVIQNASLTLAINECWWLLAVVSFAAVPVLWLLGPVASAAPITRQKR